MRQFLTYALAVVVCSAFAQVDSTVYQAHNRKENHIVYDYQNVIETDRPGFMENPNVVPKGLMQFETGFMIQDDNVQKVWNSESQKFERAAFRTTTLNSGLIKYGLNAVAELRFAYAMESESIVIGRESDIMESYFKPLCLGAKINLYKNDQVSLGFLTQLYVLKERSYPSYDLKLMIAPEFLIPVNFSLTDDLGLGFQLGMSWPESYPEPTAMHAFTLSYQWLDALNTYVQTYGYFTGDTGPDYRDLRFNGGLLYKANNKCQFDLSAGLGLTEEAPDCFIHLGFSYLFAKWKN